MLCETWRYELGERDIKKHSCENKDISFVFLLILQKYFWIKVIKKKCAITTSTVYCLWSHPSIYFRYLLWCHGAKVKSYYCERSTDHQSALRQQNAGDRLPVKDTQQANKSGKKKPKKKRVARLFYQFKFPNGVQRVSINLGDETLWVELEALPLHHVGLCRIRYRERCSSWCRGIHEATTSLAVEPA